MRSIFSPLGRLFLQSPTLPPKAVTIRRLSGEPFEQVSAQYLSFSIDISVVVGGFWWEGSMNTRKGLGTLRVPPLDLNNKKIDRLVQALGSSYLRVGGSEADKIYYFSCSNTAETTPLILTHAMWDSLHAFIQRNQLKFSFTFKYGLFKRREHGDWQDTEIKKLLEYSKQKNYQIDVCELGNELNAYWALHGLRSQPRARNLALDYEKFYSLIKRDFPETKIAGPGSAFWPKLGETIKPFSNITENFLSAITTPLDIVDWHYYPFQSERSPVRTRTATLKSMILPHALESFSKYSKKLKQWRDTHQPNAELWTGETGSAQCGGQPKLSDRFASCFWWADQLGQGATFGQQVMIRQSLIGGDYAMIDRLTLKPRPDFWVSWLWVQLMGCEVYAMHSENPHIRTYCHKHPSGTGATVLLINLASFKAYIEPINLQGQPEYYTVTSKSLSSKKIKINGIRPKFKKGRVNLSDFPQTHFTNTLPALSVSFWYFKKI